jgi:hemerythrin-like metal-binding protein
MQPLEWRAEFSVHIPQLDAQHRQIIELIGELRACAQSGKADQLVPAALDKIDCYARAHLKREELVLRVRRYPGYAEHKAEHQAYIEKVASLRVRSDRRDIGVRISNFLMEWWRNHILTSDQRYARFFRRQSATR